MPILAVGEWRYPPVEDGLIRRNPCRIKGAGQEHSQERPVISVSTLLRLLDEVPPRYWALLLLATFANLRFGELAGLRRTQLDPIGYATGTRPEARIVKIAR